MTYTDEGAKAAGAIAETTGKGIDAVREAGGFLSRVFGNAIEEAAASVHDSVRLYRAERLVRLKPRFEAARQALGYAAPVLPPPYKFSIPFIEAASLEDDDIKVDMFAALLANATAEDQPEAQRRAMVTILEQMTGLDAKVLLAAYNSPPSNPKLYPLRTVYTAWLPERFMTAMDSGGGGKVVEPRQEVQISLWNLAKLGCVEPAGLWAGAASVGLVTVTALGIALIDNATLPHQRTFVPPDASAKSPEI